MKVRSCPGGCRFLLILVVLVAVFSRARAAEDLVSGVAAAPAEVFVLPLNGPIDKSLMIVFRRAFREIEKMRPDAVVIEIDTPGGGLLETEEIVAWMRSVEVPIYAFVNTHAQSAGAIISLGTDAIYMAPGSRIGSAFPILMAPGGSGVVDLPPKVYEKILSDSRALVRGLAQENGYYEDVAAAMIDPDQVLEIGERVVCAEGELLNLTAKEAIEVIPPRDRPLLARAIVDDIPALLANEGIETPRLVHFAEEPAERLARYIVLIGPLLFSLGILGIFIEFKTPGFGLPGIIGAILLFIYFFGHYVAGLAGMEDIALVAVGFLLLAIEIFVIPGFGVTGVLGIILIVAGTVMGMIPHLPEWPTSLPEVDAPSVLDYMQQALLKFIGIAALSAVGIYLLSKLLPKTTAYRRLVLATELSQESGYVSGDAKNKELIGQTGLTATALRPAGIAMFGEQRVDVVSNGDMIEKGVKVRVSEVHGSRIVVEECGE
jgi:membrane-bound serine protease (ClpP class)